MPNLVVYVPAGLARELREAGVNQNTQRTAALLAIKELLDSGKIVQADAQPRDVAARTIVSPLRNDEVKTDFK